MREGQIKHSKNARNVYYNIDETVIRVLL
jgi:hypothetical protein